MSDSPSRSTDPTSVPQTLTDRVLARVRDVEFTLNRRAGASRPKPSRRSREAQSLRRVFVDLGDSYRDYRRRTGAPVATDVRAAANRFRRDRDVPSLVAVAALLDGLDIIKW